MFTSQRLYLLDLHNPKRRTHSLGSVAQPYRGLFYIGLKEGNELSSFIHNCVAGVWCVHVCLQRDSLQCLNSFWWICSYPKGPEVQSWGNQPTVSYTILHPYLHHMSSRLEFYSWRQPGIFHRIYLFLYWCVTYCAFTETVLSLALILSCCHFVIISSLNNESTTYSVPVHSIFITVCFLITTTSGTLCSGRSSVTYELENPIVCL